MVAIPVEQVKLTVPGLSDNPGSDDVRFAGSFVLYNYARLATLVMSFEKACREGKVIEDYKAPPSS